MQSTEAALAGMSELALRNPTLKLIIEVDCRLLRLVGVNLIDLISEVTALGFSQFNLLLEDDVSPVNTDPDSLSLLISANRQPPKFDLLCEMS